MITLADFTLVDSQVKKIEEDAKLQTRANAFYYFILDLFYSLQDDEIDDTLTDSNYLKTMGRKAGHDRGIDAVLIDDSSNQSVVNFFNFKYVNDYKNSKNHFPSQELDKINSFFNSLVFQKEDELNNVNMSLKQKIDEIWGLYKKENPILNMYFVSNHIDGLEKTEFIRIKNTLANIKINVFEIKLKDIVDLICKKDKKTINGKFRAVGDEYFGKSNGSLKSIICSINAIDLIRMVIDNNEMRNDCEYSDYETLKNTPIQEDAFDDNVRIYQSQKNKINQNIKSTALSNENKKFFFFNNGITLTCSNLRYDERTSPIVEVDDIQIVNGSQTIHSLHDALKSDPKNLKGVSLLIRIYETKDSDLISKIAEYTNSQTEVKSRDLHSIDKLQIKLEKEFLIYGYYYERKRNQFKEEKKNKRIDAEKVGQILMAYYNNMPLEAKNNKNSIFATKYDEVFSEDTTYEKIMIAYNIFTKIEERRDTWKKNDGDIYGDDGYLAYTTYIILYLINKLSQKNNINQSIENTDLLFKNYSNATKIIKKVINAEKKLKGDSFNMYSFFKSKNCIEKINTEFDKYEAK